MIEALSLLDKETAMVFVGGEESEIKEYKALASRFNTLPQCIFIGYQPYAKVVKYMKAADTLVIPFPNKPHYAFYASPLKLFEYMASGRPIIASNLPSIKEVLNDDSALLVEPNDPEKLTEAIIKISNDKEMANKMAQAAFTRSKEYTWDKRAGNTLNFIALFP